MRQPGLFDAQASDAARDEAIDRVGAPETEWLDEILRLIGGCPHGEEFTTDRLWYLVKRHGLGVPREPRAMGAALRLAARRGLVEKTGQYKKSVRPACHSRPVAIWRRR